MGLDKNYSEDKRMNKQTFYNPYPIYPNSLGQINSGYASLIEILESHPSSIWFLDGPSFLDWQHIAKELCKSLKEYAFFDFSLCRIPTSSIFTLLTDIISDSSPFGKYYHGHLDKFFDEQKTNSLKSLVEKKIARKNRVICYGFGSSLIRIDNSALAWIEPARIEIEALAASDKFSLLACPPFSPQKSYEYVDASLIRKHRIGLLDQMDLYIDAHALTQPVFINGDSFRKNLDELSTQPFRPQPIFYSKIWGGQWLKDHLKVGETLINIAGSYEFAQRENRICLAQDNARMEIPLVTLIDHSPHNILGKNIFEKFGSEFPLRLNLTDTIKGGDLSCQVHPTEAYTKAHFGLKAFMDEKYYVIHSTRNAKIHLGFKDRIDPSTFREQVTRARDDAKAFEVNQFIQDWPSQKGRVFYIPPGSVHYIGSGNLVMEIIASNILFTFRLYDHLREKLGTDKRILHIDEAWDTLDKKIQTDLVKDSLIHDPEPFSEMGNWNEFSPPLFGNSYTKISVVKFFTTCTNNTMGDKFHLLSLVDGESITVISKAGDHPLNYLETLLIPACIGHYQLINASSSSCTLLITTIDQFPD